MRIFSAVVVAALLIGGVGASARLASANRSPPVTALRLGALGGSDSYAGDVNATGQVVGESTTPAGELHAFSWTQSGGMVDLGTLGGTQSYGLAVNASGQVVGYSTLAGDSDAHAFSWTQAGGMVDLGTLGGAHSVAVDVSPSGQVVGNSS